MNTNKLGILSPQHRKLTGFPLIGCGLCLLVGATGCASDPNVTDLKTQVQTLTESQNAFQKREQQALERLESIESELDEHDFLVGELIKTEEEATLDTRHLLDKLERASSRLREYIDQTRSSTQRRDQDLAIRLKALEARFENVIVDSRSEKPKLAENPAENHQLNHQEPISQNGKHPPRESDPDKVSQASAFRSAYKMYLNGQYERSAVEFSRFVRNFPTAALTPQAYYYLGDSHYIKKEYDAAAQSLQHIVTEYPSNQYVPSALYKLGLVMVETDQTSTAQQLWARVVQEFPDSPEASLAKNQLTKVQGSQ